MTDMNLGMTERLRPIHERVSRMVREEIIPLDDEFLAEVGKDGDRWQFTARQTEILEGLKAKARERGLWNFWLTDSEQRLRSFAQSNMPILPRKWARPISVPRRSIARRPIPAIWRSLSVMVPRTHKKRWLEPLLEGKIRSAYLMTEPDVASSDATNIAMTCEREGDDYVLNGEKWWASGAGDPRCAIYIVMVKTSDSEPKHKRHSMILVPADAKGVKRLRAMKVYGDDDAPHGHLHLRFENVRVPKANLILGEGRGFEIAQGRLGPGRIHHCMRAIGQAEMALEAMCRRSVRREAFGQPLAQLGSNYDIIAECRMDIEMARLLCLKAAWMIDQGDAKAAAPWISQIKVVAPRVALKVTDEAIQMHGAQGISQDTPLARAWTHLRTLRLADGPDAVHRRQVARAELKNYTQEKV